MHMGEANTVALMSSLELSSAMSYVAVLSSSPVCLSVVRASLVSWCADAGA